MELPLQIFTKDSLYEGLQSRDISFLGIFVLTGTPLPEGTIVDVSVYIPEADKKNGCHASMLNASGKVIRVEKMGIAIKFDKDCRIFPAADKTTH